MIWVAYQGSPWQWEYRSARRAVYRREMLDHIIALNEYHLRRLAFESGLYHRKEKPKNWALRRELVNFGRCRDEVVARKASSRLRPTFRQQRQFSTCSRLMV